jgi:hypothetical protein
MVAAAEERWRRSTTAATLTRLCGRCEVGGTALASSRLGARQRVADGDETADNERDHGGCTPSSMRSNTGGCCARVAERRAEHLGLPMYIWAGSCASAAPGRRKKCICYGSAGLCFGLLAEIGEDQVGFWPGCGAADVLLLKRGAQACGSRQSDAAETDSSGRAESGSSPTRGNRKTDPDAQSLTGSKIEREGKRSYCLCSLLWLSRTHKNKASD